MICILLAAALCGCGAAGSADFGGEKEEGETHSSVENESGSADGEAVSGKEEAGLSNAESSSGDGETASDPAGSASEEGEPAGFGEDPAGSAESQVEQGLPTVNFPGFGPVSFERLWFNTSSASTGGSTAYGEAPRGIPASAFQNVSRETAIEVMGYLLREEQTMTGILASVSLAQFIVESGYGQSKLAQEACNFFGMKTVLSGNTWDETVWDGISYVEKETYEETDDGERFRISAKFRRYSCLEDSITDHSAYLLSAENDAGAVYPGLSGETDYRRAAEILKEGGYATSTSYVDLLCRTIEENNLTRFDASY